MLEILIEEHKAARTAQALLHEFAAESPAAAAALDPKGPKLRLAPGVHLDHLHPGAAGSVEKLYRAGVTSWTLAVYGESPGDLARAAAQIEGTAAARDEGFAGLYLEGPFIGPAGKAAADGADLRKLIAAMPMPVAAVVFAPEAVETEGFVKACLEAGARPLIGYTEASYDECAEAFAAGAKGLCLPFIATPPFHHRSPGPIGAALECGAQAEIAVGAPGLSGPQARIIAAAFKAAARPVYHPGGHPGPVKGGVPADFCASAARRMGAPPDEFLLWAAARAREGAFVLFDEKLNIRAAAREGELVFSGEGA